MGAAGHQRVTIHVAQVGPLAIGQPHLLGRGVGVREEALREGPVRLEREQAPIQRVGLGRREAIVRGLARGSGHSTTALP